MDPSRLLLVLKNMDRHLRTLTADLPAAPGDPRAGERVVLACEAISLRLKEIADRMERIQRLSLNPLRC